MLNFTPRDPNSNDGLIAGGNDRSSWGVLLLGRRASKEVPRHGLPGRHGEEQQQPETLLQVGETRRPESMSVSMYQYRFIKRLVHPA